VIIVMLHNDGGEEIVGVGVGHAVKRQIRTLPYRRHRWLSWGVQNGLMSKVCSESYTVPHMCVYVCDGKGKSFYRDIFIIRIYSTIE
jgi:hypothetical protein